MYDSNFLKEFAFVVLNVRVVLKNDNEVISIRKEFHSKDLKDKCRWIPISQQLINARKSINSNLPPMNPTHK